MHPSTEALHLIQNCFNLFDWNDDAEKKKKK